MNFDPSFFLGETRNDFYITPMIKKTWAAELEVLSVIDTICAKYNIPYFAAWGTLLGAVRHEGFIPWDDDLDIGMRRADFERFCQVAPYEFPKDMFLHSVRETPTHNNLIAHIYNTRTVSTAPEHLTRYHGCPYMIGTDIFIYDNVPDDKQERAEWINLFLKAYQLFQHWEEESSEIFPTVDYKMAICREVEEFCQFDIISSPDPKHSLALLSDYISSMYQNEPTANVSLIAKLSNGRPYYLMDVTGLEPIRVPFETTTIPIVKDYSKMLTLHYGSDYMTPTKRPSSHNYPCYKSQYYLLRDAYLEKGLSLPLEFVEDFDDDK